MTIYRLAWLLRAELLLMIGFSVSCLIAITVIFVIPEINDRKQESK